MDRQSMSLRKRVVGHKVEMHNIFTGIRESFTVTASERDCSGYILLKGEKDSQRIYVPSSAVQPLIDNGFCSFIRQNDTTCLEYHIRIY